MDAEQLYLIQARADAATPARWQIICRGGETMGWDVDGPECGIRGAFYKRADAEFVAHAREDIPALLAALYKQQAITVGQLQTFGEAHADAERKALRTKNEQLRAQLANIEFAARMPDDYEHGLPAWINSLYVFKIGMHDREGNLISRSEDLNEIIRLRKQLAAANIEIRRLDSEFVSAHDTEE